jgi:two-component system OmpR family response regulator
MARILVVDDEPRIVEVVQAYLERDGHRVDTAGDGDRALELAGTAGPDLIVLDVMLPGQSGFDVLRNLRERGVRTPVIMLTARDDVIDRVAGLELGADDYVTKPFEPRELVARVGAVLRRLAPDEAHAPQPSSYLDLVIDRRARVVRRGDTDCALTRAEFDLLAALVDHGGAVLSREQLGSAVFGESFAAYDRTIDSHVKNLRRKLGSSPDGGQYLETVRGLGYRAVRQ